MIRRNIIIGFVLLLLSSPLLAYEHSSGSFYVPDDVIASTNRFRATFRTYSEVYRINDPEVRAFASRARVLLGNPGSYTRAEIADETGCPEIEFLPTMKYGVSAGGFQAWSSAQDTYKVKAGAVAARTASYGVLDPMENPVVWMPVLIPCGAHDQAYARSMLEFLETRENRANVSVIVSHTGTHFASEDEEQRFWWLWYEDMLNHRLNGDVPTNQYPQLRDTLYDTDGWLVRYKERLYPSKYIKVMTNPEIYPFNDAPGTPTDYLWMPSKRVAEAWRNYIYTGDLEGDLEMKILASKGEIKYQRFAAMNAQPPISWTILDPTNAPTSAGLEEVWLSDGLYARPTNWTNDGCGIWEFTIQAQDALSNTATRLIRHFYPDPANTNPTATITWPLKGSIYTNSTPITLIVTGDDPEDGTNIVGTGNAAGDAEWHSSRDGVIGRGGTVTVSNITVGRHIITALIFDDDGGNDADTIYIDILPNGPSNNTPVAMDDQYTGCKNQLLSIPEGEGLLNNDSDADFFDTLTAKLVVKDASHGVLNLNTNGSFTYTPHTNFLGRDTFYYRALDGTDCSDIARVDIVITNDGQTVPHAMMDVFSQTGAWTLVLNVLSNDFDFDDDPLSIINVSSADWGSVSHDGTNVLYTPPSPEWIGAASFSYTIEDAVGFQSSADVVVSVNGGALPAIEQVFLEALPRPSTRVTNILEGMHYEFRVAASDSVVESKVYYIRNMPDWASFNNEAGVLCGTSVAGIYTSIVIGVVTESGLHAELEPFDITVRSTNNTGSITCQINGDAEDGILWRCTSGPDTEWYPSGTILHNQPVSSNLTVEFSASHEWLPVASMVTNISANALTVLSLTGTPSYGYITVSIEPASAISSGAQWRILQLHDSYRNDPYVYTNDVTGWQDGGATGALLALPPPWIVPDRYILEFSSVSGWYEPIATEIDVTTGQLLSVTGVYWQASQGAQLITHIEPVDVATNGAQWRVVNSHDSSWKNSGETNLLVHEAGGPYTVEFKNLALWVEPEDMAVMVTNIPATVVTGTYTQTGGDVTATILPQEAVDAGAQWRLAEALSYDPTFTPWMDSGVIYSNYPVGWVRVEYKSAITNWEKPATALITVAEDTTQHVIGVYYATNAASETYISCQLSPAEVISAGAQWRVSDTNISKYVIDPSPWQDSGAELSVPYPGTRSDGRYLIEFTTNLTGWVAPVDPHYISVTQGVTNVTSGIYSSIVPRIDLIVQQHGEEGSQDAEVLILVDDVYTQDVYVVIAVGGGTASNELDYTVATNVLLTAGQSNAKLTVSVYSDTETEGTETVVLNLIDTTYYSPGVNSSAVPRIFDRVIVTELPFRETFETSPTNMAGTPGSVSGQHGWIASGDGAALVQNSTVHGGAQALSIADASASHSFIGNVSNVWISFWSHPVFSEREPNVFDSNAAAVFYVNTNAQVVAYNSTNATVLNGSNVSNDWNKFEIHCDYISKVWNLELNDTPVLTNFAFYGSPAAFGLFQITEASRDYTAYVDDIAITDSADDSDGDNLPDEWEYDHFGDLDANPGDPAANPDYTVWQCYIAGLDPTDENAAFALSNVRNILSWSAASGRVYTIYWTSNLLSGFDAPMQSNVTGGAFTDSTHSVEDKGFYKIEVQINK